MNGNEVESRPQSWWFLGLVLLVGVPIVALMLIMVGYVVSVEGAPLFHWLAFPIMIIAPLSMSLGFGLLAVDGVARLAGMKDVFVSHPLLATRIYRAIVVLCTIVGYYSFGWQILQLINVIDCDTYTHDARAARPRCDRT